ncbi:hypothetical protein HMPREF9946_03152 [Acetobacteraceae bacterium AT-5844]|nr:hypothetical protein HMPREF9946_03152 [Acetobacteraceae bacterium AT-5844]
MIAIAFDTGSPIITMQRSPVASGADATMAGTPSRSNKMVMLS